MTELQKRQCMTCALQQRSLNDGLICSLTQEKPQYETKCHDRKRLAKEEASFLELFTTKNTSLHIRFAVPQPPEFITQDPMIIKRYSEFDQNKLFFFLNGIFATVTLVTIFDKKYDLAISIIMLLISIFLAIFSYRIWNKNDKKRPFLTLSIRNGLTIHDEINPQSDQQISWNDILFWGYKVKSKSKYLLIYLFTQESPIEISLPHIELQTGLIPKHVNEFSDFPFGLFNKIEAFRRRYHQIQEAEINHN